MSIPKLKRSKTQKQQQIQKVQTQQQKHPKAPHGLASCVVCGKKAAILGFFVPNDSSHWFGKRIIPYIACKEHAPSGTDDLDALWRIENALSYAIAYRQREQEQEQHGGRNPSSEAEDGEQPSEAAKTMLPSSPNLEDIPAMGGIN